MKEKSDFLKKLKFRGFLGRGGKGGGLEKKFNQNVHLYSIILCEKIVYLTLQIKKKFEKLETPLNRSIIDIRL